MDLYVSLGMVDVHFGCLFAVCLLGAFLGVCLFDAFLICAFLVCAFWVCAFLMHAFGFGLSPLVLGLQCIRVFDHGGVHRHRDHQHS